MHHQGGRQQDVFHFGVRQEVARQLREMQETGVIEPSSSPWLSSIVLVRKKNGTLVLCVDYRELNSVTKADTFPLPQIHDLLDQLGSQRSSQLQT